MRALPDDADEPAFPCDGKDQDVLSGEFFAVCTYTGITKRELIAAMVLQGICGAQTGGETGFESEDGMVRAARRRADKLLIELSDTGPA
jgi:hypothetical protein